VCELGVGRQAQERTEHSPRWFGAERTQIIALGNKFKSGELTRSIMTTMDKEGTWIRTYHTSKRSMERLLEADKENPGKLMWERKVGLPESSAPRAGPAPMLGPGDRLLAYVVVLAARAGTPYQKSEIIALARGIAISLCLTNPATGVKYDEFSIMEGWYNVRKRKHLVTENTHCSRHQLRGLVSLTRSLTT
jgi:hypothetical protein